MSICTRQNAPFYKLENQAEKAMSTVSDADWSEDKRPGVAQNFGQYSIAFHQRKYPLESYQCSTQKKRPHQRLDSFKAAHVSCVTLFPHGHSNNSPSKVLE